MNLLALNSIGKKKKSPHCGIRENHPEKKLPRNCHLKIFKNQRHLPNFSEALAGKIFLKQKFKSIY